MTKDAQVEVVAIYEGPRESGATLWGVPFIGGACGYTARLPLNEAQAMAEAGRVTIKGGGATTPPENTKPKGKTK